MFQLKSKDGLFRTERKSFEKRNYLCWRCLLGIDDNEIILLRDKGNSMSENVKGDIKIFIKSDEQFIMYKRQGLDLIFEKKISLKEPFVDFLLS